MRIILYTGKGGVGKTSVAAATALKAAELGYRTIVVSTDIAHSLGDSLDIPLSGSATRVADNLWAQEIDVYQEIETHWSTIRNWLIALLQWQGVDRVIADEIAILPGMEELAGLLYITRYHSQGEYEVLVIDCAPTGETLRLLSFPETVSWYMKRIFPMERRAFTALRPIISSVVPLPLPGEEVFDSVEFLYKELDRMRSILTNPAMSSVRLVMNAEKMVVKETQRTHTYLNLYGYFTDLVICNRLLPRELDGTYFDTWKESQSKYFKMIEEGFAPIPIKVAPLFGREVVGLEMLREMSKAIFGEEDPTQVFYQGQAQTIERENGNFVMRLPLAFTTKEDLSILLSGDELIIQAGHYRRNIFLPRSLIGLPVEEAKLDGKNLKLKFRGRQSAPKR